MRYQIESCKVVIAPSEDTYRPVHLGSIIRFSECIVKARAHVNSDTQLWCLRWRARATGLGCSKLTASLFNVSLKFQMLIFPMCQ